MLSKNNQFFAHNDTVMLEYINKLIIKRAIEEIFNRGKLYVADELIAPDYVNHDASLGQEGGAEGVKFVARLYRTAFPDLHLEIEEITAMSEKVAITVKESGTHTGPFGAIPPTNRFISWTWHGIYRIEVGKLVERWGEIETVEFRRQIALNN